MQCLRPSPPGLLCPLSSPLRLLSAAISYADPTLICALTYITCQASVGTQAGQPARPFLLQDPVSPSGARQVPRAQPGLALAEGAWQVRGQEHGETSEPRLSRFIRWHRPQQTQEGRTARPGNGVFRSYN